MKSFGKLWRQLSCKDYLHEEITNYIKWEKLLDYIHLIMWDRVSNAVTSGNTVLWNQLLDHARDNVYRSIRGEILIHSSRSSFQLAMVSSLLSFAPLLEHNRTNLCVCIGNTYVVLHIKCTFVQGIMQLIFLVVGNALTPSINMVLYFNFKKYNFMETTFT